MITKTRQNGPQTLGSALEKLVLRECRSLHRALAIRKELHKGIHESRKACRRLRSALAFLPPSATVDALDETLRQLIHSFSPQRDAYIATRTARLLGSVHEAPIAPGVVDALRIRCKQRLNQAVGKDPHWRRRRAQARRMTTSLAALPWRDIRSQTAKKTLKRTKKKMKKAHAKAQRQRTPATSHRWRRRARKLRYQLDWLRKARHLAGMKKNRTKRYDHQAKHLSTLTDQLGWRQDFQVFLHAIEGLPDSDDVLAARSTLKAKSASLSASEPHASQN
ncbi:CHAD domain-containing protein [Dyella monticola]|uniref:CHAD domain-containing protein n=1 Tax=Dyella monticola TaxID=1927958 RepID=A0A370X6D5_9GAMM|nr:CHAD domain-containing protein [Dyella monticola]RDS83765.1 CHAD domain-containing protein [Dyella monticola]